jgi:hypothetical protein
MTKPAVIQRVLKQNPPTLKLRRAMAETEGFEPSIRFPVYTLSRRAPSTTRTSLHFFYRAAKIQYPVLGPEYFLGIGRCNTSHFFFAHFLHYGQHFQHIF